MMKKLLVIFIIGLSFAPTAQATTLTQIGESDPSIQAPSPRVSIETTPHNPPIIIPSSGGTLSFSIQVTNIGQWSGVYDIWTTYTLPDGTTHGPLFGPEHFMQPAQWTSQSSILSETIAPDMPAGTYTYNAYAGTYPDGKWASDSFTFEKQPVTPGWYPQNSGTTEILSGLDFVDPDTGWVVGQNTVLHTSNGGDSWFEQSTPTYYSYYGVDFINSQEGWIVGGFGTILHTIDGGQNWTIQDSGYYSGIYGWSDLQFIDSNQGWVVGGYHGPFGQQGGIILHTSDGGVTWQTQFSQDNLPPLVALSFVDENNGWAVSGSSHVLHTSNGGLTWTFQDPGQGNFFRDVSFINLNRGWIVDSYYSQVLRTSDGGNNWESFDITEPIYLESLYFTDANTGWLAGGNNDLGKILKSTDGGQTWQEQYTGDLMLFNLDFVDALNGWVVGWNGLILHTETGGD